MESEDLKVLRWFKFDSKMVAGVSIVLRDETVRDINNYAEKNRLKIVQVYGDGCGLFVLFEKL